MEFSQIKAQVSIAEVLAHYEIPYKGNGQVRARCPLPDHKGKHGEDFSASIEKGLWTCHSCHLSGDVIRLVALIEKVNDYKAAGMLMEWYKLIPSNPKPPVKPKVETPEPLVNLPLSEKWSRPESACGLRGLDYAHPYLRDRGFNEIICERFGVGYYEGKGQLSGRILFPIHNAKGQLLSYCGRDITGEANVERWKHYAGFHKSLELYNLNRVLQEPDSEWCVVVESFWGVLALWRAGVPHAVALMGSDLSEAQEGLLVGNFSYVMLLLDGDKAGREGAAKMASRLVGQVWVRVVELPDDVQPDHLAPDALKALVL